MAPKLSGTKARHRDFSSESPRWRSLQATQDRFETPHALAVYGDPALYLVALLLVALPLITLIVQNLEGP